MPNLSLPIFTTYINIYHMTNVELALIFLLCSFVCFLLQKLPIFGFLWKCFAAFYIALLLVFVSSFVKTKIKKFF